MNKKLTDSYNIAILLILFGILFYLNKVLITRINTLENGRTCRSPIKDKLQDMLNPIGKYLGFKLIILIDVILYIAFAYAFLTAYKQDNNMIILNDFIPKLLILFYVRLFCIWVTEIPTCMNPDYRTTLSPILVDCFFSSHTMFFLATLMYLKFFKKINKYAVVGLTIFYMLMIVAAKEHYTIDVTASFLITYLMFKEYM